MKLSDGVEWALHCATVLAAVPPDRGLTAAKLAEFHDVPSAYLAKHLQALTRAGIFEAVPGRRGGYRLARPASEISVLDVVDAVEGRLRPFLCSEIRQRGPVAGPKSDYRKACGISRVMYDAENAYRDVLKHTSLTDLITGLMADAPHAAVRGATWLQKELSS